MSARAQASDLIKGGQSPIEVAVQLKKNMKEVARMLLTQVGEGELTYADIVFSMTEGKRREFDHEIEKRATFDSYYSWIQSRRSRGVGEWDRGELDLYALCREYVTGDMYRLLRELEFELHQRVRELLEKIYPKHDDAWWTNGVPVEIRKRCAQIREEDPERFEAYAYTNFIDLKKIIDSNWGEFVKLIPKNMAADKKKLLKGLDRLNAIRNRIMHPTKLAPIIQEEYEFVRRFGQAEEDS